MRSRPGTLKFSYRHVGGACSTVLDIELVSRNVARENLRGVTVFMLATRKGNALECCIRRLHTTT